MNTVYTSLAVTGIILLLIFIFWREIISYKKTNQAKRNQYVEDLKGRCQQEQERLKWIAAGDKSFANKVPDLYILSNTDLGKLDESELSYFMSKIQILIQQLGSGEVKHPDTQARAEVFARNIARLKDGNAKTSRAGRATAHAAKHKRTVTLDADSQKKF